MRRSVSVDELDKLQIDETGQLYWDGMQVITKSALTLPWWVDVAAVFTSAATVGMFILMVCLYRLAKRRS